MFSRTFFALAASVVLLGAHQARAADVNPELVSKMLTLAFLSGDWSCTAKGANPQDGREFQVDATMTAKMILRGTWLEVRAHATGSGDADTRLAEAIALHAEGVSLLGFDLTSKKFVGFSASDQGIYGWALGEATTQDGKKLVWEGTVVGLNDQPRTQVRRTMERPNDTELTTISEMNVNGTWKQVGTGKCTKQ